MKNFNEIWIYTDFLQNQNQNFAAKQILLIFGMDLRKYPAAIDLRIESHYYLRGNRPNYEYYSGSNYQNNYDSYGMGFDYGKSRFHGKGIGLHYATNGHSCGCGSAFYGWEDSKEGLGCGLGYGNDGWLRDGFLQEHDGWGHGDGNYSEMEHF